MSSKVRIISVFSRPTHISCVCVLDCFSRVRRGQDSNLQSSSHEPDESTNSSTPLGIKGRFAPPFPFPPFSPNVVVLPLPLLPVGWQPYSVGGLTISVLTKWESAIAFSTRSLNTSRCLHLSPIEVLFKNLVRELV